MTKKQIVDAIAEDVKLTQAVVHEIVERIFDGIINSLEKERRIELRNFGVFEVKKRKPRKAHNPLTGEKIMVPAKFVVRFKPGLEMEDRVRKLKKVPASS
jgi:integration host factor subunit beta